MLPLALVGALALHGCQDDPITGVDALSDPLASVSTSATTGVTEAPDLVEVGNFRDGPRDDDGNRQTLVDFTFDQIAYVNGGDYSNFHLVPLDGGDAVDARAVQAEVEEEGDVVVTVLFRGKLKAKDYARGFVDTGIVNSDCCNMGPENPGNINQAAPISNEGRTENPDLVSVTRDGDQVLFEFDEPLTDDDVVQNTSGLRVYFPETSEADRIREAGALAVRRLSPTVLRAYYGDDLPEGYTLADAVGGFVTQGSVQAAEGSRGANDGVNAFDEYAPMGDTGAQVCAAPSAAGGTGDGAGPTEAPDLMEVRNFRRGPFTGDFEATTCVDFVFDQVAYLNGGNRSSFHLVPLSGGDALDGSSNQTPESDVRGDHIVTVIFPGALDPSDFARGFVDSEIVNSAENDVSSDNPANINQAADVVPGVRTENPDLLSVKRDGDSFLFEFDEALNEEDVSQNSSGLRLYFPEAKQNSTIPFAGSSGVERVDESTLRAFYNDYPADYGPEDAVGAYVVQGTVQAAQGSRGANDGKNAFDEVKGIVVVDAAVCRQYAPLDAKFVGAGPTEAPDLVRVGNFREGPRTTQFEKTTCVDFSFDQVAYLNGGDRSNFHLVPRDGGDALDGSTNVIPDSDEPGDYTVTVIFEGDLDPANFARGYVDGGVVNSDPTDITADSPSNVNQAEDVRPNTRSENPDLVRVSREGNSFLFEFDEALTEEDVVQNNSGLQLYFATADQQEKIPTMGASRVERVSSTTLRAFYEGVVPEGKTLEDVVGAFVDQGSVQAADGGKNDGVNAFDEVVIFGNAFPSITPVCNGYLATIVGSGRIAGTSGRDVIVGSEAADEINGYGGDDVICGLGGDDLIKGEAGNDALFGDDDDDDLRGQAGVDLLYGGYGADLLRGETGGDSLFGGAGNDDLRGQADADFFDGGPGTDESDYDSEEDRGQVRVP